MKREADLGFSGRSRSIRGSLLRRFSQLIRGRGVGGIFEGRLDLVQHLSWMHCELAVEDTQGAGAFEDSHRFPLTLISYLLYLIKTATL